MTFTQLINALEAALAPRVANVGGKLEVAESLETARTFLSSAPSQWRVILHWEGFGEHPAAREGMTVHQVATVIQAPRGMAKISGPTRTGPAGQIPFADRVEQVLAMMASLRFPDGTGADVAGFALGSSQWLETVSSHSAHVLNWTLVAALPGFSQTIPLTFPHLT